LANDEQLAILTRGVGSWNAWRAENPGVAIDLSGAKLHKADLTEIDLSEADLSDANLHAATLIRANLGGANLRKCVLIGADLHTADLSEADLTDAHLRAATLTSARLTGAKLHGAGLKLAHLHEAHLIGSDLTEADLTTALLSGASLVEANITGAKLNGADLKGACVRNIIYDRQAMKNCYYGIRVDDCYGNAVFKRDAQDQDYIDTQEMRCTTPGRKLLFAMWGFFTDYGRSLPRVASFALLMVVLFGVIFKMHPGLIDFGRHQMTAFTPFYFSFVTYTTLGFGDVTAMGLAGEILVAVEVVLGYLILGLLLAILANTVARRS
jgi:uncharacterized protein YjbI with pentapeptide repeats